MIYIKPKQTIIAEESHIINNIVVKFKEYTEVSFNGNSFILDGNFNKARALYPQIENQLIEINNLLDNYDIQRIYNIFSILDEITIPFPTTVPKWNSVDDYQIEKEQYESNSSESLPSINLLYHIILEEGTAKEDSETLINALNRSDIVELSYAKSKVVTDNLSSDNLPSHSSDQRYLFPSQHYNRNYNGIDAHYSWNFEGGKGENVNIVQLEACITDYGTLHEDMQDTIILTELENCSPSFSDHAIGVGGIISMDDNAIYGTGISPSAKHYFVETRYTFSQPFSAVPYFLAFLVTNKGDIITMSVGSHLRLWLAANGSDGKLHVPAGWVVAREFDLEDRLWIEFLSKVGERIVLQAAGNHSVDLDDFIENPEFRVLDCDCIDANCINECLIQEEILQNNDPNYELTADFTSMFDPKYSTKSFIIGGGHPDQYSITNHGLPYTPTNGQPRHRAHFNETAVTLCDVLSGQCNFKSTGSSNGSRVNLQAWFYRVYSINWEGARFFNGTSAATPMVAAVVANIQSIYKENFGIHLTPDDMLQLLQTTGMPQLGTENIGPLPDLRAAINSILNIEPPSINNIVAVGSSPYNSPVLINIDFVEKTFPISNFGYYSVNESCNTFYELTTNNASYLNLAPNDTHNVYFRVFDSVGNYTLYPNTPIGSNDIEPECTSYNVMTIETTDFGNPDVITNLNFDNGTKPDRIYIEIDPSWSCDYVQVNLVNLFKSITINFSGDGWYSLNEWCMNGGATDIEVTAFSTDGASSDPEILTNQIVQTNKAIIGGYLGSNLNKNSSNADPSTWTPAYNLLLNQLGFGDLGPGVPNNYPIFVKFSISNILDNLEYDYREIQLTAELVDQNNSTVKQLIFNVDPTTTFAEAQLLGPSDFNQFIGTYYIKLGAISIPDQLIPLCGSEKNVKSVNFINVPDTP